MKKNNLGIIKWLLGCLSVGLWMIILLAAAAFGQTASISITQIIQTDDEAVAYVSMLDENGDPVNMGLEPEAFHVSADEHELDVTSLVEEDKGITLLFCVDCSRYMDEEQLNRVKEAISGMIGQLTQQDAGGLITFGEEILYPCALTKDKEELLSSVKQMKPSNGKALLYEGIREALEKARKGGTSFSGRTALVVFASGYEESDAFCSEGEVQKASIRARIPIYVVGLEGAEVNSVEQISQYSGGAVFTEKDGRPDDISERIMHILKTQKGLKVKIPEGLMGKSSLSWKAEFTDIDHSVKTSPRYVFSTMQEESSQPFETESELTADEQTAQSVLIIETGMPETETQIVPRDRGTNMTVVAVTIIEGLAVVSLIIIICILRRKRKKDTSIGDKEQEPAAKGIELEFIITSGKRTEKRLVTIRDSLVLGRGKTCDVDVTLGDVSEEAKKTSRRHAILSVHADQVYVQDAGAVNGTVLNGIPVRSETLLNRGDILKLGDAVIEIRF